MTSGRQVNDIEGDANNFLMVPRVLEKGHYSSQEDGFDRPERMQKLKERQRIS